MEKKPFPGFIRRKGFLFWTPQIAHFMVDFSPFDIIIFSCVCSGGSISAWESDFAYDSGIRPREEFVDGEPCGFLLGALFAASVTPAHFGAVEGHGHGKMLVVIRAGLFQ